VAIDADDGAVHRFSGYTEGAWVFTAWLYVPEELDDPQEFHLLNTYPASEDQHWSLRLIIDSNFNHILDFHTGQCHYLIRNSWTKLEVTIDLDQDLQTVRYNDDHLVTKSWSAGAAEGGAVNIAAVDLWGDGSGSEIYYDNLSLKSSHGVVGDVMPPDWRGQDRSTMQCWDFNNPANPFAPTQVFNPYGTPVLHECIVDWYEYYFGLHGVIGKSADLWGLQFDLPNYPGGGQEKWIWIQITTVFTPKDFQVIWGDDGYWQDDTPPMVAHWLLDDAQVMETNVYWITIPENPPSETLEIWYDMAGGHVDSVVIDTLCLESSSSELVWDNYPDGPATGYMSSQLDTVYPFDSQTADDFLFDRPVAVKAVEWNGGFWGGDPVTVPEWNIIFYADAGGMPTGGPTDPTDTALAHYVLEAADVDMTSEADGSWTCSTTLPSSFVAAEDQAYWIAIQAAFPYPPQWGISTAAGLLQGSEVMFGFPLLGYPYWVTGTAVFGDPRDMAFRLYGAVTLPPCPAAFDDDGDVDTADLLFLLGAWGTPDGDVDGDGDTDTADLLALLAAWGECP
jgi:hypothetical protein